MPPPPYAPGAPGAPTGPSQHPPPPPPPPPASSLLHPSTPIAYAFQVHMATTADAALNPVPVPDAAELSTLREELQGLARTAATRSLDLEREIAALEQWISTARRTENARPPATPVTAPGMLADRTPTTPLAGPIDLTRSNSWTNVAVPGAVSAAGARTDRSRPSRSVEPASPASSVDVKSEPGLVDAARRKRSIGALDDVPPPPRIKIKVEDTRTASAPLPLAMPMPSTQPLPHASLPPNGAPALPVDPHRKRKLERRGTASSSGSRRSTTAAPPPAASSSAGSPQPGASPAPPAAPAIPPPPPAPPGMTAVQYVDRPYYYRNFLGEDAVAKMPATETLQGDDYSKVKVNDKQQTALPTFYSYIDAWLRPVTEDDIAFLTKQNASVSASTTPGAVAAAAAAAAAAVAPSPIPGRNSPAPGAPTAAAPNAAAVPTIGTSAVPTDLARYFLVPKLGKPHLPQVGTSTSPLDPATPAIGLPPHAHPALDVAFDRAHTRVTDAHAARAQVVPLHQRLLACLLPDPDDPPSEDDWDELGETGGADGDVVMAEAGGAPAAAGKSAVLDGASTGPWVDPASVATLAPADVEALDDRLRGELRALGLLDGEDAATAGEDDDFVAESLRSVQSLLRDQLAINTARRARLAHMARMRLAYQEYLALLDDIDKQLEKAFIARYCAKPAAKKSKKKASAAAAAAIADGTAGVKNHEKRTGRADSEPPPPQGPTTEPFPDHIGVLMQKRRDLIASAGAVFAGHDEEAWKIPCASIYDGIPRNVKLDEGGAGAGPAAVGGALPAASGPPPLPVPPAASGKAG
ncbi:Transcriptional regulator [Allomyces javanicus]|nr:Transcriptional regulator [Allomyces javanicus]